MAILNLTQHAATPEQIAEGVVDLPRDAAAALRQALTFDSLPTREEIQSRAREIAALAALYASGEDREDGKGFALSAMIGGAPWLMGPLSEALREQGLAPIFAFCVRETEGPQD